MRKLTFETLESRNMMAVCSPVPVCYDVDNSGVVEAADVLQIVNDIDSGAKNDVNCDNKTSPLDALLTINHINRFGVTQILPVFNVTFISKTVESGKQQLLAEISYSAPNKEILSEISIMIMIKKDGYKSLDEVSVTNLSVVDKLTKEPLSGPTDLSGSNNELWGFTGKLNNTGTLEILGSIDKELIGGKIKLTISRLNWHYNYGYIMSSVNDNWDKESFII